MNLVDPSNAIRGKAGALNSSNTGFTLDFHAIDLTRLAPAIVNRHVETGRRRSASNVTSHRPGGGMGEAAPRRWLTSALHAGWSTGVNR